MRPLLVLLVFLAACGRDDLRDANVVLIGIDTLRADHVGAYGYPRPTTPRLDAFSRDAVRFETAVSQSSWTTPAFASMFTGLVPSVHGGGEGRCPDVTVLDDEHATLATVLRTAGYRTASFVSNVWVGAEVGLARGFDEHEQLPFSAEAVDRAIGWLRQSQRTPFFLFVHIMDPHQPWIPDPDDARLFLDPTYQGPIGTSFTGLPRPEWNEADRRRIVDLYDGEVRWADRLAGRILDALDELDLAERTLVVVTSDHGEELFDHGQLGHGQTLFDELLRVPFLIRFPDGWLRGPVAQPVRTMDLFPTVLEAVGQAVPGGIDGVSLMPLLRGESLPQTGVALSEYPCFASDVGLRSLRTPSEKLVVHPVSGRTELFDLVGDPREQTDVAASRAGEVAALRARLAAATRPVRDGFELIVRAGAEDGLIRARLEALSTFRDVVAVQGEPGDRIRVTRDGKVLDLKLRLTMKRRSMRSSDIDGVSFLTDHDLPFVLRSLSMNGVPMSQTQLTLGNGQATAPGTRLPLELGVTTPGLLVRFRAPQAGRLDLKPRAQVAFVRRVAAPKTVISPEMAERLRAMGYMQ